MAALRERGVDWLAPSDAQGSPLPDDSLIASIAACDDARLRAALTGLFLLHPSLADVVPEALAWLKEARLAYAEVELMARYMAAAYLQRLWRTRLQRYLAGMPDLPDLFSSRLELPAAQEGFGKPGLFALAQWHAQSGTVTYNRLAEYNSVLEHLIASLKLRNAYESTIAS